MEKPSIFFSFNHEDEDSAKFHDLITRLAAIAGETAFSEANALNMPKVYASPEAIILQKKDGSRTVLATAASEKRGAYFKRFVAK